MLVLLLMAAIFLVAIVGEWFNQGTHLAVKDRDEAAKAGDMDRAQTAQAEADDASNKAGAAILVLLVLGLGFCAASGLAGAALEGNLFR